jgi:hypothetical protein
MNVLSHEQQIQVLHMLVEGSSLRSITRLTKVHRTTVMKLMVKAGNCVREFLNRRLRNLSLAHIQVDEIWTFVQKKQNRLRSEERDNLTIGDQYLYIGLDQPTKLVACWSIGKRLQGDAESFMLELSTRIVTPQLDEEGFRPQISTDGFNGYPSAIDLAFADTVRHGVLKKTFKESKQPGRYGPPELNGEERVPMHPDVDPLTICTSHVERHNLSIRTFMRRFTRLALGFSKKLENLEAATALYIAHYNFCRWHGTLNKTPAMAAGLTGHPWTMEELLSEAGMFQSLAA